MIKNISILKTQKFQNSIFLLFTFFIFSCTSNQYYDDKDIVAILDLSMTELSNPYNKYIAIEFAPRLKELLGDEIYLERFLNKNYLENKGITQKDIGFMVKNNQYRFTEKKFKFLSDYINLNDLGIKSNPYFKGEDDFFKNLEYKGFLRLSFPYISIDEEFAIIGYEYICDGLCGSGGKIIFSKNEMQKWIISKKYQEWVE